MATGWMNALKVIPWRDVIDAAPNVVKGARKIFARTEEAEAAAAQPVNTAPSQGQAELQARLARVEAHLATAAEQQKSSARLIESLAEQNARIVEAVEILRVRSRMLTAACGVLAVLLVASVAVLWGAR